MSTIREQALARVEGYNDAGPEFERINALTKDIDRLGLRSAVGVTRATYDHLLRTSSDPEEVLAAHRAWRRAVPDANGADEVKRELEQLRASAVATTADLGDDAVAPALEWLNEQLGALMSRVRTLDSTLGSIRSVEAALHGTDVQIAAWRDIDAAMHEYQQFRDTQKYIPTEVAGRDTKEDRVFHARYYAHGFLRNAFDHEEEYLRLRKPFVRRQGWEGAPEVDAWLDWRANVPTKPLWPREAGRVWPDDDGGRHDYLRWLARESAAWVPTLQQLDAVGEATETMLRTIRTEEDLRAAVDAHDAYYARRGLRPRVHLDVEAIRAKLPQPRTGRRRLLPDAEGRPPGLDPRFARFD